MDCSKSGLLIGLTAPDSFTIRIGNTTNEVIL